MPVDNFDKIRRLMEFRSDDDFYFVQIIQRKKDHGKTKVNGTNNNSRLVKAYYVKSVDHLNFLEPEIKELCEIFNARAGINMNRRSWKKTSMQTLRKITDQIINEDYTHAKNAFNTVCGKYASESDKIWILDVDEIGRASNDIVMFAEEQCRPEGRKFVAVIPSKNGYHILMNPFDLQKFKGEFPDIEVHKNNPTNLYIP